MEMGNTQRGWILYIIVLVLNFLMLISKQQLLGDTGLKERLIQYTNLSILECLSFQTEVTNTFVSWNLKDAWLWRRGSAFVSTGNKRLWIHSRFRWTMMKDEFLKFDRWYLSKKVTTGPPRTWSLSQIFSRIIKIFYS